MIWLFSIFLIITTILTRSVLEEIISSFDLKKKIIINFLKDKLNDNCVDIIISYLNSIEKFRYPLLLKLDSELYEPLVLLTNTLNNNPCSNISINFSLYSKYDFNSDKLTDFYINIIDVKIHWCSLIRQKVGTLIILLQIKRKNIQEDK